MALTGRFWFRRSWTGRVVLLVEEQRPRWLGRGARKPRWRNARLLDFAEPELRPLMAMEKQHRSVPAPAQMRNVRPAPSAQH
jgi:hypothetical protein